MLLRWLTTSVVLILTGACKPHRFVYSPSEIGYVIVDPNDDIHIRSLEVLTGVGELGVPRQRAMAMAVADYGPIKEHKITMGAGIDSLCTKEGGVDAATTAINDPRVLGIIGTTCSLSAVAASPIVSKAGLVMISSANSAPSLILQPHSCWPKTERIKRGAEVAASGPFMQFRGCSKCAFAPSFSPEKLQIRELRL